MNDSTDQDTLRLKQMLEEVTAADATNSASRTSAVHNAETASLREAWLAFDQLIRAADASLPTMTKITAAIAPRKPRRSRGNGSWWAGLMAATAAALLVAVALGWWIRRDGKLGNNEPSVAETAIPEQPTRKASNSQGPLKQDLPRNAVARVEKAMNRQPQAGMTATPQGTSSTWEESAGNADRLRVAADPNCRTELAAPRG